MSPEVAEEMKDAEQDSPFKQHQLDDTDPIEDNDNSDTDKKVSDIPHNYWNHKNMKN